MKSSPAKLMSNAVRRHLSHKCACREVGKCAYTILRAVRLEYERTFHSEFDPHWRREQNARS